MDVLKKTFLWVIISMILLLPLLSYIIGHFDLSMKNHFLLTPITVNATRTKTIIPMSTTTTFMTQISHKKYIFSFEEWRWINERFSESLNKTICDVPEKVQPIANAFCLNALGRSCPQLPCLYVKLLPNYTQLIHASTNGRSHNTSANQSQPIECLKSPALELFMHGPPYPSFTTNGFVPFSKQLMGDVFGRSFRSPNSIWSLELNDESVGNYPLPGDKSIIALFDVTFGYDRTRYQIIQPQYLPPYIPFLLNQSRLSFQTVMKMKQSPPTFVTAPIFWMNSNCNTKSNRTRYMEELMKHIRVDSWGTCSRNKGPDLPPEIQKIDGNQTIGDFFKRNWRESKEAMSAKYLFTIAIENSDHFDYVTEKLWQPLAAGSVPIYHGAPNIDDWLPCHHCIIDVRKFSSPAALADYIKMLEKNMTLYGEYHKWRNEPVRESFVRLLNYFERAAPYSIDSVTCAMAHSEEPRRTLHQIVEVIGPDF